MPEYRLEPTKQEIVVVAAKRAKRPTVFGKGVSACPFCPGSEHITPPTTFSLPSKGKWGVRSFRNGFPILDASAKYSPPKNWFEWKSPGFGEHEVIVETSEHGKLFQNFDKKQLSLVFQAYKNRFVELSKRKDVACVFLFKNHGKAGGASIEHEHAQVTALPFVPPLIAREVAFASLYEVEHQKCFYCELKKNEGGVLFENAHFIALRPSFARFPYEFWLIPKRHVENIAQLNSQEATALMSALSQAISKVSNVSQDYNLIFHNSPLGGGLHFHCEIIPRTNVWAGFELGTGVVVDSRSQEQALEELSGKAKK